MANPRHNALNKMLGAERKLASKKFGHELSKRPKILRDHVLAGMRLGILKHPTIKLKDRIKSLTDK